MTDFMFKSVKLNASPRKADFRCAGVWTNYEFRLFPNYPINQKIKKVAINTGRTANMSLVCKY